MLGKDKHWKLGKCCRIWIFHPKKMMAFQNNCYYPCPKGGCPFIFCRILRFEMAQAYSFFSFSSEGPHNRTLFGFRKSPLKWILLSLEPKFHDIYWRKRMEKKKKKKREKERKMKEIWWIFNLRNKVKIVKINDHTQHLRHNWNYGFIFRMNKGWAKICWFVV